MLGLFYIDTKLKKIPLSNSNLVLRCWGQHLQLLLPLLLQAPGHHPGLGGHQGAQALLRSGLVDQQGLAGLQGAHQLPPGLQLVPEVKGRGCMALIPGYDSFVCMCVIKIGCLRMYLRLEKC